MNALNSALKIWPTATNTFPYTAFLKAKPLLAVLFIALINSYFLLLFVLLPTAFNRFALEDAPIEILSAALYLINSLGLIFCFFYYQSKHQSINYWFKMAFLGLALVFFLISMEEISWFQRYLDLESEWYASHNMQYEINLHNFATDQVELAYYFLSFIFLVFLPFFQQHSIHLQQHALFKLFIPSPIIAILATHIFAYNYDMWNNSLIQFSYFFSLAIVFYYIYLWYNSVQQLQLLIITAALLLISQLYFIIYGDQFVRWWDVTEYKEFLLPLVYSFYSLELFYKIKSKHNSLA